MCEITDNHHFKMRRNRRNRGLARSAKVTHLRHGIVKYKPFKVANERREEKKERQRQQQQPKSAN